MKLAALWFFLAAALVNRGQAQADIPNRPPAQSRENEAALFNGRDFSGFAFCMRDGADPSRTWTVTNGVIHCTGTPAGYLRTTQVYSNYFLTVEWRLVRVAPKADAAAILVHLQPPDQLWPQCVLIQGKHGRQGDIFLLAGAECKEHRGLDQSVAVPRRGLSPENPVGEWNRTEIICIHHKVEVFINGTFVNEITECTLNGGYIGFQSAGAEFEIRSVFFSPLKY